MSTARLSNSISHLNSKISKLDGKRLGFSKALREFTGVSVEPNDETYSILLKLCGNERLFKESSCLFSEIINPTTDHYNQLIKVSLLLIRRTAY